MSINKQTILDHVRDILAGTLPSVSVGRLAALLQLAWQVRRERNQLARLSQAELGEMGIHAGDAAREVERGFFDLPNARVKRLR